MADWPLWAGAYAVMTVFYSVGRPNEGGDWAWGGIYNPFLRDLSPVPLRDKILTGATWPLWLVTDALMLCRLALKLARGRHVQWTHPDSGWEPR